MNITTLFAGGAIFGILAAFWNQTKEVLWKLSNLVIQRVELCDFTTDMILAYVLKNYKLSSLYDKVYRTSLWGYEGQLDLVPYEDYNTKVLIFWNGWYPLIFVPSKFSDMSTKTPNTAAPASEDGSPGNSYNSCFIFLRGTFNFDDLLKQTWKLKKERNETEKRFRIYQLPSWEVTHENSNHGMKPNSLFFFDRIRTVMHQVDKINAHTIGEPDKNLLDQLIFSDALKVLIEDAKFWVKSKEWYVENGIPWKLGWLLFGPPGSGKTMLVRALGESLDLPIFQFDLSEYVNDDFVTDWKTLQYRRPCIALFEDFDNIFHGRENVYQKELQNSTVLVNKETAKNKSKKRYLTFDCLLNVLDGVDKQDGVFVVITTNDLSKVDSALGQPNRLPDGTLELVASRPGRIDKLIELGYMTLDQKLLMVSKFFEEGSPGFSLIMDHIANNPNKEETIAQFQEKCISISLRELWRG